MPGSIRALLGTLARRGPATPCWRLRLAHRVCCSATPGRLRGQGLCPARLRGHCWGGGGWLGHTPGPAAPRGPSPPRETDAYEGKSLAYCHPSWSAPPGTLKSTDQSDTWGRGGSVGQPPAPAPARPQPAAHPGPLQGRRLRAGLRTLLQPGGVTPHVPVGGQAPDAGRGGWG